LIEGVRAEKNKGAPENGLMEIGGRGNGLAYLLGLNRLIAHPNFPKVRMGHGKGSRHNDAQKGR